MIKKIAHKKRKILHVVQSKRSSNQEQIEKFINDIEIDRKNYFLPNISQKIKKDLIEILKAKIRNTNILNFEDWEIQKESKKELSEWVVIIVNETEQFIAQNGGSYFEKYMKKNITFLFLFSRKIKSHTLRREWMTFLLENANQLCIFSIDSHLNFSEKSIFYIEKITKKIASFLTWLMIIFITLACLYMSYKEHWNISKFLFIMATISWIISSFLGGMLKFRDIINHGITELLKVCRRYFEKS